MSKQWKLDQRRRNMHRLTSSVFTSPRQQHYVFIYSCSGLTECIQKLFRPPQKINSPFFLPSKNIVCVCSVDVWSGWQKRSRRQTAKKVHKCIFSSKLLCFCKIGSRRESSRIWIYIWKRVLFCPHLFGFLSARDNLTTYGYNPVNQLFQRNRCCLSVVPNDIPAPAVQVYLHDNMITSLPAGVFYHLHQCQVLHLDQNQIPCIKKHSFSGLNILKHLFLHNNPIQTIDAGSFDTLYYLDILWLSNTKLADLDPNIFVNLPRKPLDLALASPSSQLNCSALCWLKYEELHGTVEWGSPDLHPTCEHGEDWSSLECSHPGESDTPALKTCLFFWGCVLMKLTFVPRSHMWGTRKINCSMACLNVTHHI